MTAVTFRPGGFPAGGKRSCPDQQEGDLDEQPLTPPRKAPRATVLRSIKPVTQPASVKPTTNRNAAVPLKLTQPKTKAEVDESVKKDYSFIPSQPSDVQRGMIVHFYRPGQPGSRRGWVDNIFQTLAEFWVCDEETKQIVYETSAHGEEVKPFCFADLQFTGEWADDVKITETVDVPDLMLTAILEADDWEGDWEERLGVVLQVERPDAEGGECCVTVGPARPPRVKAAVKTLTEHFANHAKEQAVEFVLVPPEISFAIERTSWANEYQAQSGTPVKYEAPPIEGLPGKITLGPAPQQTISQIALELSKCLGKLMRAVDESEQYQMPLKLDARTRSGLCMPSEQAPASPPSAPEAKSENVAFKKGWEAAERLKEELLRSARAKAHIEAQKVVAEERKHLAEERTAMEAKAKAAPAAEATAGAAAAGGAGSAQAQSLGARDTEDGPKTVSEWRNHQNKFAHLPPLQSDWIRVQSRKSGAIYFVNVLTGKTSTSLQEAGANQLQKPAEDANGDQARSGATSESEKAKFALPDGWREAVSRSSGKVYYFNDSNGEVSWDRPGA